MLAGQLVVVVPSDRSEDRAKIDAVNRLHSKGAVTVGRVNQQSIVFDRAGPDGRRNLFNQHIREIRTDVFSTVGGDEQAVDEAPAAAAAGVAALVLEKWPKLTAAQIRERIVGGARRVWQATSLQLPNRIQRIWFIW